MSKDLFKNRNKHIHSGCNINPEYHNGYGCSLKSMRLSNPIELDIDTIEVVLTLDDIVNGSTFTLFDGISGYSTSLSSFIFKLRWSVHTPFLSFQNSEGALPGSSGSNFYPIPTTIANTPWKLLHICITIEGQTVKYYLNGKLNTQHTVTTYTLNTKAKFVPQNTDHNAGVHLIRTYNYALSEDEILKHWNNGKPLDYRLELSELVGNKGSLLHRTPNDIYESSLQTNMYNSELVTYQGETNVAKVNPTITTNPYSYLNFSSYNDVDKFQKILFEFEYFVPNDSEFKNFYIENISTYSNTNIGLINVVKGSWQKFIWEGIPAFKKYNNLISRALFIKGGYGVNSDTNNDNTIIYIKSIKSRILGCVFELLPENCYQDKWLESSNTNTIFQGVDKITKPLVQLNNPLDIVFNVNQTILITNPQPNDLLVGLNPVNKVPDFKGQKLIFERKIYIATDNVNTSNWVEIGKYIMDGGSFKMDGKFKSTRIFM